MYKLRHHINVMPDSLFFLLNHERHTAILVQSINTCDDQSQRGYELTRSKQLWTGCFSTRLTREPALSMVSLTEATPKTKFKKQLFTDSWSADKVLPIALHAEEL